MRPKNTIVRSITDIRSTPWHSTYMQDNDPATPDMLADRDRARADLHTRADCPPKDSNGRRRCPWLGCVYHLGLDVSNADTIYVPGLKVKDLTDADIIANWEALEHHCALDVVDHHKDGATLQETAECFGLTRERMRQIEAVGMLRFTHSAPVALAELIGIPAAAIRTAREHRQAKRKAAYTPPVMPDLTEE